MKPLDLTKPVRLSDGSSARVICTDCKGGLPVIVLVTDSHGRERTYHFQSDGTHPSSVHRLVNIPNRVSGWINIYGRQGIASGLYLSKEDADRVADATCERDACIYVEVDEGEGL